MTIQGIWLPLVTPFRDGALDETSLRRMVRTTSANRSTASSSPRRPARD